MANENNLKPMSERTKRKSKKGGIASGESRRTKKSMLEFAKIITSIYHS